MIKVKAFNVLLTLAAFAALFFFLPADKDASSISVNKIGTSAPQKSITQKAHQQQPIGHILHSA